MVNIDTLYVLMLGAVTIVAQCNHRPILSFSAEPVQKPPPKHPDQGRGHGGKGPYYGVKGPYC